MSSYAVSFVDEWQLMLKCLLEPWVCARCPLSKMHSLGKSVAQGVTLHLIITYRLICGGGLEGANSCLARKLLECFVVIFFTNDTSMTCFYLISLSSGRYTSQTLYSVFNTILQLWVLSLQLYDMFRPHWAIIRRPACQVDTFKWLFHCIVSILHWNKIYLNLIPISV
jgi:hypothetical protein